MFKKHFSERLRYHKIKRPMFKSYQSPKKVCISLPETMARWIVPQETKRRGGSRNCEVKLWGAAARGELQISLDAGDLIWDFTMNRDNWLGYYKGTIVWKSKNTNSPVWMEIVCTNHPAAFKNVEVGVHIVLTQLREDWVVWRGNHLFIPTNSVSCSTCEMLHVPVAPRTKACVEDNMLEKYNSETKHGNWKAASWWSFKLESHLNIHGIFFLSMFEYET